MRQYDVCDTSENGVDSATVSDEQLSSFFHDLYDQALAAYPDHVIEVRLIRSGEARSLYYESVEELLSAYPEFFALQEEGFHVHFGPCLRPASRQKRQEDISILTALWVDCDAKEPVTDKIELLLSHIFPFQPMPSYVVDSGHGFHLYWVLKEPLAITVDSPLRRQARCVLYSLMKSIQGGDSCFNFDRVLRLPGTMNIKDPANKLLVAFDTYFKSQSYSLQEFIDKGYHDESAPHEGGGRHNSGDTRFSDLPAPLLKTLDANNPLGRLYQMSYEDWAGGSNGGDNTPSGMQFALARELFRAGYDDEDVIADVLVSHNSYDDKHDHDWLCRTISKARESIDSEGMNKTSTDYQAYDSGSTTQRVDYQYSLPLPVGISASELMSMDFSEPDWVIEDLITPGLAILGGNPKTGKSFMGMNLGVSLAMGSLALGRFAVKKSVVLYLALEDKMKRLQMRLQSCCPDNDMIRDLVFYCEWPRGDKGLTLLSHYLDDHPEVRLVIVDTLAKISPEFRKSKQAGTLYNADYNFISALKAIADKHNLAILCTHHLTKSKHLSDPLEELSGSMGISGAADTIMILRRSRGDARGTLLVSGRDVEEHEYALQFDKATTSWTTLGDSSEYERSEEQLKMLQFIRQHSEGVTIADVVKWSGKSRQNNHKLLNKLCDDGLITKVDTRYLSIEDGFLG